MKPSLAADRNNDAVSLIDSGKDKVMRKSWFKEVRLEHWEPTHIFCASFTVQVTWTLPFVDSLIWLRDFGISSVNTMSRMERIFVLTLSAWITA